jgi:hypothetical protein
VPTWLRAALCIIIIAVMVKLFAEPIYIALMYAKDFYVLSTHRSLRACQDIWYHEKNNLARLVNDGPEENQAMVPLSDFPRLKAKVTALRNQVDDMKAHLVALENIVKQQSALNKQQEAKLAKIETNQSSLQFIFLLGSFIIMYIFVSHLYQVSLI